METITCRLLPYAVADGALNMAADEALLHTALDGTASLRFYGWSSATLSLGYFQPASLRHADPLLATLSFVRRPSGGDALVHDQELTYALALPVGTPWQTRGVSWLGRMHAIIAAALRKLGVETQLLEAGSERPLDGPLCFRHLTPSDVLMKDAKIAGSAQRKRRGALLQHGAILLARSAHTPSLPGIRELTSQDVHIEKLIQAVCAEFTRQTGWLLAPANWIRRELDDTEELAASKYRQKHWNEKR